MKHLLVQALCAGLGGCCGAVARFGVGLASQRIWPEFPAGTMVVNVLGCLLLGLVMGATEDTRALNPALRSFLTVGLLGSFTTFSTFSYEGFELIRSGQRIPAMIYVVGSVVAGLLIVLVGYDFGLRWAQRA